MSSGTIVAGRPPDEKRARRVLPLVIAAGLAVGLSASLALYAHFSPAPIVVDSPRAVEQPSVAAPVSVAAPAVEQPSIRPAEAVPVRDPMPELVAPLTSGYYGVVSSQIFQTLTDYKAIVVPIPAADPRTLKADSSGTAQITIRTPYWINDDESSTQQTQSLAKAPPDLQKTFREIPAGVRQGKGNPREIGAAMQSLLATGYVRDAYGSWPPSAVAVEDWMGRFGIGADCSAFVYDALSRTQRALMAAGMGALSKPLEGPPTYVGSRVLATGGDAVRKPIDLQPGDMMYRAPYPGNPVGHIRIIDDVQKQDRWVVFNTAEARGDGVTGPTTRWWRYPAGSGFAKLEEYVGDGWQSAEDREQGDVYSRRLPTRTSN